MENLPPWVWRRAVMCGAPTITLDPALVWVLQYIGPRFGLIHAVVIAEIDTVGRLMSSLWHQMNISSFTAQSDLPA
jgi:hypothetical protein